MKKILLLLAEGFETFEACVYIDIIGWNLEEGDGSTKLYSCALRKEIKSSFNQRFVVDYLVDEININDFDAIAIPGGFEVYGYYKDAFSDKFTSLIRAFYEAGKPISTICVGALPTAKSGILEGKNATTYNNPVRRQTLAELGANVKDEPIVCDSNIVTSWNPSTAVDVVMLLLEQLTSKENVKKVRKLMGF